MTERSVSDEALLALERSLKSKLNPIAPDHHFVGDLRNRLESSPEYLQQHRLAVTMLTIAAGLVVGLGIVLIGQRFLREV